MISLQRYSDEFESAYKEQGKKLIDTLPKCQRETIRKAIRTLFPDVCSDPEDLLTISFEDMNTIVNRYKGSTIDRMKSVICQPKSLSDNHSKLRVAFKNYHDLYNKLRNSSNLVSRGKKRKTSMALLSELDMTVCPYCNRDYINSRSENKSGAQLDHFFNRSTYPFFSISLYNLIPCCSNCNHIKGTNPIYFSPFGSSLEKDQKIFHMGSNRNVEILSSSETSEWETILNSNFEAMGIKEAYSIHENEIQRLFYLSEIYCDSQLEECNRMFSQMSVGASKRPFQDFQNILYGFDVNNPDFKNHPLSKLKYDILKDLGVIH